MLLETSLLTGEILVLKALFDILRHSKANRVAAYRGMSGGIAA